MSHNYYNVVYMYKVQQSQLLPNEGSPLSRNPGGNIELCISLCEFLTIFQVFNFCQLYVFKTYLKLTASSAIVNTNRILSLNNSIRGLVSTYPILLDRRTTNICSLYSSMHAQNKRHNEQLASTDGDEVSGKLFFFSLLHYYTDDYTATCT